MDPLSHLFWSLTIFHSFINHDTLNAVLILFISILPDLPWLHFYIYKFKKNKKIKFELDKKKEVVEYINKSQPKPFRFSHSLVTWFVFSFILVLFFKNFLFLSLVYLFHIIVDIPTHSKEKGPSIFYPFSEYRFSGWEFEEHRWLIVISYILLILVNLAILLMKII